MNRCRLTILVLLCVACGLSISLAADAADAADATTSFLKAFFQTTVLEHDKLFQKDFLKAVPPARIDEIKDLYLKNLGNWKTASPTAGSLELVFEKGKAPCKVHFDAQGLVDGLWFGAWELNDDSPEAIRKGFAALSGSSSVTLTRNGSDTVFEIDGNRPLAVGSAFKLSILKALDKAFAEGKYKPETIVPLRKEWFSLPSGILQAWPPLTPVTIQALANLMISISDNTATDHLLYLLGRKAVEAEAPERVRPFLGTMEMFRVKYGPPERALVFAAADPDQRLAAIASMANETVTIDQVRKDPFLVDSVEWFYTTRELTALLYELASQAALSINPGLVDRHAWHRVAFKGGSEPGVLNYTILLQKAPGSATYCLSATVNDLTREVDTATFDSLVQRLIGLIAGGAFDPVGR